MVVNGNNKYENVTEKDIALLRELVRDSSQANKRLAGKVDIAENRIAPSKERLAKAGLLKRHTVEVDYKKLGFGATILFTLKLKQKTGSDTEELRSFLIENDKVVEVVTVLGPTADFIVKIMGRDLEEAADVVAAINRWDNVDPSASFTMAVARTHKSERGPANW